jgi:hypothetical protein
LLKSFDGMLEGAVLDYFPDVFCPFCYRPQLWAVIVGRAVCSTESELLFGKHSTGLPSVSERRLQNWVAFAEIASAIAVVLSLIYVGLEVRRSTLESDADIQAELLSYTVQRRYLVIENRDLGLLLAEGYADPANLSADEKIRFQSYIELFYVAWERAFNTAAAGVFSEELFDGWDAWFVSVAESDPRVCMAHGAQLAALAS